MKGDQLHCTTHFDTTRMNVLNGPTSLILKGKVIPLHAIKAPGGRGGIAPTHSQPRH
jgi:hypothetical protein